MLAGETVRFSASEELDHRVESSSREGQEVVAISLPADINALAAEHAAEGVVGEASEVDFLVDVAFKQFQGARVQTDLEVSSDADQLAAALDRADLCVTVMGGHEQFEAHALQTSHRWSVGPNHQTFTNFLGAGGNWPIEGVDLNKAQPARGVRVFSRFNETHIGNKNPILNTGLKN